MVGWVGVGGLLEGSHVFENGCCFGLQLKLHKYMLYGNWLWVVSPSSLYMYIKNSLNVVES